jgi:transposase-like protein
MELNGRSAGEGETEERSDEGSASPAAPPAPDPEVVAKPTRRQFTAPYRLRIVQEADRCTAPGEVGRLLRREGLYSSHLSVWRKTYSDGALGALSPKKRGRKAEERNPLEKRVRQLEVQLTRTQEELRKANLILDMQGKVAGLLGFSLKDGKDS